MKLRFGRRISEIPLKDHRENQSYEFNNVDFGIYYHFWHHFTLEHKGIWVRIFNSNGRYDKNDGKFAAFDRIVDLSTLKEIDIDIETVSSRIHEYRRRIKPDRVVKISLFVPNDFIKGFSYLYKSMLSDDLFKLEIFETLEKSAEYLSVDKKLLEDAVK